MERPDLVTFDCYGTLIDWEGGIVGAFTEAAANDGVSVEPAAILDAYHQEEPAVQSSYRKYREVLAETAVRVGARLGWTPSDPDFLAASLPRWKPFADTNDGLQRMRDAGIALGILSNIDDDLLRETRRHFPVSFNLIVTAEQVRSYKPGLAHFQTASRKAGGKSWLHAAQSWFHDIQPASSLGISTAWVNRKAERPGEGGPADLEVRTVGELASRLVG